MCLNWSKKLSNFNPYIDYLWREEEYIMGKRKNNFTLIFSEFYTVKYILCIYFKCKF